MTDAQMILPLLLVPVLTAVICYVLLRLEHSDRETLRREQERVNRKPGNRVRYCLRRRIA